MKKACNIEKHLDKPLRFVCTNPSCTKSRLLCFRCLGHEHKDCLNHILEIDDIYKRNLPLNINWVHNKMVKQTISTIRRHEENSETEDQLFKTMEELIEQEFCEITKYVIRKIQETKEKVIKEVKKRITEEDIYLKSFKDQLKNLYNFDVLVGILESLKAGEKDLEAINYELDLFFKEISLKESQINELDKLAETINSLAEDIREMNQEAFEDLKDSLSSEIFNTINPNYITKSKMWTWNPISKSEDIALTEHNMIAVKTAYYSAAKTVVVGTMEMSNGHYKWEIDFAGSVPHRPCFAYFASFDAIFGIMEKEFASYPEDCPIEKVIGLCVNGKRYNMNGLSPIADYRRNKFTLDLDLKRGVFIISQGRTVLSQQKMNLKGRSFYPVMILYCVHDRVTLRLQ